MPNVICFQTQKQLAILNSIGVLLKGVSIDLHAPNFMHVKTSLHARCVHACNRVHNLSSPANDIEDVVKAASKIRDQFNNLLKANNFKDHCLFFFFFFLFGIQSMQG